MKFNSHITTFDAVQTELRKKGEKFNDTAIKFYNLVIGEIDDGTDLEKRQRLNEMFWYEARRPYYNVWPKMSAPLSRLDLSIVKSDQVKFPLNLKQMAFQFSEWDTTFSLYVEGEGQCFLKSLLAVCNNPEDGVSLFMNFGIKGKNDYQKWAFRRFPLTNPNDPDDSDFSIADCQNYIESFDRQEEDHKPMLTNKEARRIVSLVIACCLIEDENIISPDLLNKDKGKVVCQRLIDKAHKRGKVGWDIGARTETDLSPHFRRPHLATFHVGRGRKRTIVKLRKGSFVKREKAIKVPTGYKGKE